LGDNREGERKIYVCENYIEIRVNDNHHEKFTAFIPDWDKTLIIILAWLEPLRRITNGLKRVDGEGEGKMCGCEIDRISLIGSFYDILQTYYPCYLLWKLGNQIMTWLEPLGGTTCILERNVGEGA
jgi:hypothetical protein